MYIGFMVLAIFIGVCILWPKKTKPQAKRFCVDCEFHKFSEVKHVGIEHLCFREGSKKYNLITGDVIGLKTCEQERKYFCGEEGKYFKKLTK